MASDEGQEIEGTLLLLEELLDSIKLEIETDCLQAAICSLQDTFEQITLPQDHRPPIVRQLIRAFLTRYGLWGWVEDLDACVQYFALGVFPEQITMFIDRDTSHEEDLVEVQVASELIRVCQASINSHTLANICCIAEEALLSISDNSLILHKAKLLVVLGKARVLKYLSNGQVAELNQAAEEFQHAELIYTDDAAAQLASTYVCLMALSHIRWLQFIECSHARGLEQSYDYSTKAAALDEQAQEMSDAGATMAQGAIDDTQLQEGISLLINSLHRRMEPHPRRVGTLNNLGCALLIRFEWHYDFVTLEECILLHREALNLSPLYHPTHSLSLMNLANALHMRFKHKGALQDLEECATLYRGALDLLSPSDPIRSGALNNLAAVLSTLFARGGLLQDLDEIIALYQESLDLQPSPSPARASLLNNLAGALLSRFDGKGDVQNLRECITFHREALNLHPPSHPNRSTSLDSLATALFTSFIHDGSFQSLEECIALHRQALLLRRPSHADRSWSMNNLANALCVRFKHKGAFQDLQECISLYRESLGLRPLPHPHRPSSLNNLANALYDRFLHKGVFRDLEECISLYQESLKLQPPQHPSRYESLSNLAVVLRTRFKHKGALRDLEECINLHREALGLQSQQNPARPWMINNLATSLINRFEHQGAFQDLEDCITLYREALDSQPPPHPGRLSTLNNLANVLCTHSDHLNQTSQEDIQDALDYYKEAVEYPTGPLINRLGISRNWATSAQKYRPDSTLGAYKSAMELLPQLASLELSLQQRQDVLQHSRKLAGEAAKCAINASQCETAVTFLSTGRSIFWAQALQLRTLVDELMVTDPVIAERYIAISRQLEDASYFERAPGLRLSTFEKQYTGDGMHQGLHVLANQRRRTIEEIRRIAGYEDFLMPPSYSTLQSAAKNGPIVMLNASAHGCDALIMHETGPLVHIPLVDVHIKDLEELRALLHMLIRAGARSIEISPHAMDSLQKLIGRDMVLESSSDSNEDIFPLALECLWIKVVQPVVKALGIEKTDSPSRIWWCPTGLFASLPIHAAGVYSANNEPVDCVSQYAVSSYCTSPQDLLHPMPQVAKSFTVTAVIEPEAPNAAILPATLTELGKIMEHIPNHQHLLRRVGSKSAPNQVKDLVSDIQRSSIVHFGCHGMQNLKDPLESCLLLSGGKLTMSKIIKECRVPEGALAYLSACETAKVDEERPDESLNLVATMMFAGFRSVVGTLWSIMDEDAPIVADVFYRHLFRNGKELPPDVRDAAYGLHLATKELRDRGKSFYNWVPYVHYGI